MYRNLVSFPVYFILEDNKLLVLTGRICTGIVVLSKMFPQIRIIREDILKSIRLTDVTKEMFSPAVFEEFLLLKIPTATKFAFRMISPSMRGEI